MVDGKVSAFRIGICSAGRLTQHSDRKANRREHQAEDGRFMFERRIRPEGRGIGISAFVGEEHILSFLVACLRIRHMKCHCDGSHPLTDGNRCYSSLCFCCRPGRIPRDVDRGGPTAIVKFAACSDLANAMPDIC